MKIIFKTIKKDSYELELENEEYNEITVLQVKEMLELNFGIDSKKLKLIFNSKILSDDSKLKDRDDIIDGSIIIMSSVRMVDKSGNSKINIEAKEEVKENDEDSNANEQDQEEREEKIVEANIRPENAVKYIASIMKVLSIKDPNAGREFIKNFEEDNPAIFKIIKSKNEEFKKYLYSPKTDEDVKIYKKIYGGDMNEGCDGNNVKSSDSHTNNSNLNSNSTFKDDISTEDKDNINKLTEFGFEYNKAKQAYFVCDKNFELALNFLYEGGI